MDATTSSRGPVDVPRASPAAAAAALASFVDGVDSRDAGALEALAPPGDPDAGEVLAGVARNADALDLRAVSARYVDQVGTVAADGSWTGIVDLTWQLGGLDPGPSRADVAVSFAPEGDGLAIAGFGAAGRGRVPLWLRGELSVARADGVLVLVDGTAVRGGRGGAAGDAGIDVVRPRAAGLALAGRGRGPGECRRPRRDPRRRPRHLRRNRRGHHDRRDLRGRRAGPRLREPRRHGGTATRRRAGRDEPRARPRGHGRGAHDRWSRGCSRGSRTTSRCATRGCPTAPRSGARSRWCAATVCRTRCRRPRTSTRGHADLQARYEEAWLACRIIAERLGEQGPGVGVRRRCRRGAGGSGAEPSWPHRCDELTADWRGPPAPAGTVTRQHGRAEGDRRPVAFSVELVVLAMNSADPMPSD